MKIKCPACGYENYFTGLEDEGDKFCSNCNKPLVEPKTPDATEKPDYASLDLHKENIEAYKQAIRINPDDAGAYYNLGLAYGKLGLYEDAIEAYKQAIRINPDHASAYYNLGITYRKLDLYKDAIEACKQAIRINPNDAVTHFNIGLSYFQIGDKSSVLDEYKILKELDIDLAKRLERYLR